MKSPKALLFLAAARNTVPASLLMLALFVSPPFLRAVAPTTPVYSITTPDFITGDNQFSSGGTQHWSVDPGADIYSIDQYERPMDQSFSYHGGTYATNADFYGNLDLVAGSLGYDATFLYVKLDLFDTSIHKPDGSLSTEGLKYDYRFRISTNADGSGGFLLGTQTPGTEGTAFHLVKNYGHFDANGDVDTNGNGFENQIISDGLLLSNGADVLYARLSPTDSSVVEFALNYAALGFTQAQISTLAFFVYEATKDQLSPANYQWNKEYTALQAGSPNGGPGGLSEFGTPGLGNIYHLDTLSVGPVPEPGSALLVGVAGMFAMLRRRRQ